MNVQELGEWINAHYRAIGDRLFRMEVLPEYAVDSDGEDFRRWLSGAQEPTWSRKQPWLDVLADDKRRGLRSSRLRIFSEQLTDYERYACDFGYAYNAEYEDIRVLHRGEHHLPADLVLADFWLIGDEHGAAMHYDQHGRFEYAEVMDPECIGPLIRTRDLGMEVAEPFVAWWLRHPELHRTRQVA
jgi:hypothetical protein